MNFVAGTSGFLLFSLIMMRMSGFVFMNPVLGRRGIPPFAKAGMTLVLALLIYSIGPPFKDPEILSPLTYGVILIKEFFIGYAAGYVMYLFDFAITFAGAIIDFQMGLSMATVYDPVSGAQTALSGRLLQIYFMLLFFAVDGHLAMMEIIVKSADFLPFGTRFFAIEAAKAIPDIFVRCVELGVKLAFPFIAIELLAEVAVGILMKMIPQINLFVLSIQFKIVLGLALLIIFVSPIGNFLEQVVSEMLHTFQNILYIMSGS